MTSNEVRVYVTEAIAQVETEHRVRGYERDGDPTCYCGWHGESIAHHRDEERLAVVETLHTPCPNPECHYGIITRPIPATEHSRPQAYSKKCPTCGGTGYSALLAFDEMRSVGSYQPDAICAAHKQAHGVTPASPLWDDPRWNVGNEWGFDPQVFAEVYGEIAPTGRFPVALLSPDTTETP